MVQRPSTSRSLGKVAQSGLSSLVIQTSAVFAALLLLLLATGGKPNARVLALSVILGILGIAWAEMKRLATLEAREQHNRAYEVAEFPQPYTARERDFRFKDLRGHSFEGKDLSYADFSAADIRGANFKDAVLRGSRFCRAKAGLETNWFIILVITWFAVSISLGYFSALAGDISGRNFASYFLSEKYGTTEIESMLASVSIPVVLLPLYVLIINKRLGVITFLVLLGMIVFGTIAWTGGFNDLLFLRHMAFVVSWGGGGIIGASLFYSFSGAVFGNVLGFKFSEVAGSIVSGLGTVFVILVSSKDIELARAIGRMTVVVSGMFLGGYISWYALSSNRPDRENWLRDSTLNLFSTVGGTSFLNADLTDADFASATLKNTDLRAGSLIRSYFRNAQKLNFSKVKGTLLDQPDIRGLLVTLNGCSKDYSKSDLRGANLRDASLKSACFKQADLSEASLVNADLSDANLTKVKAFGTDFTNACLTGAILESWGIDSNTNLNGVECQYIFLLENSNQYGSMERRPSHGDFAPGEFTLLFEKMLNTIDLIFRDGVDWQAFLQSFQELRSQYSDLDLTIQGIEKRKEGAFVIRLAVSPEVDKALIEKSAKDLYKTKLALIEEHYRAELQAKDSQISDHKQQSASLMEIIKLQAVRSPMAEIPKYDLRGAQFAGGFAETVRGHQTGGTINNYGAQLDDITRLISSLREKAQSFPVQEKNEAFDVLDDLETDIKNPDPDPKKIGRRLKRLTYIVSALGALAGGAATFSGNLTEFTSNIDELAETIGIPLEQIQPSEP